MLWVRVPSPTPDKEGDRGYPGPLFLSKLGRRQVVRQGTLTPSPAGSSPAVPAKPTAPQGVFEYEDDPVAQPAEQLPFKQWVRGSNPRRVTKEKSLYRCCFSRYRDFSYSKCFDLLVEKSEKSGCFFETYKSKCKSGNHCSSILYAMSSPLPGFWLVPKRSIMSRMDLSALSPPIQPTVPEMHICLAIFCKPACH